MDQYRTFYSCMYRSLLFPRKFYEIDAAGNVVHYSPYNGEVLPGYMFITHFFHIDGSLVEADEGRSHLGLNDFAFLRLETDHGTYMTGSLFFRTFFQRVVGKRRFVGKRFIEFDNKVVLEVLGNTQPSPWINDYGQFAIMPVVGAPEFDQDKRASWFSHKSEVVKPTGSKASLPGAAIAGFPIQAVIATKAIANTFFLFMFSYFGLNLYV